MTDTHVTATNIGELPPLLTVAQVCEMGQVCRTTAYKLIEDGTLESVKIRNARRVRRDSVARVFGL